jgi:N-hydroxyarylamine O-acetyltransferase
MRSQDYHHRIGVSRPLSPSLDALRRLHAAHRETFLFENLTIQEGGAISVALHDIERKFLDDRRGGYCFEHNTLFAAALRDDGFDCDVLLGRVRRGLPAAWARTHMVLAVSAGSNAAAERWLCDVGFGSVGLVEPMRLCDGAVSHDRGLTYRLRRERHVWVLSMADASGEPTDLYEFSEDPQTEGDVAVANHFTATHPTSIFRRSLTIQGVRGSTRTILRSGVLTEYVDGVLRERSVDRAEVRTLAHDLFGVDLPAGPLLYETAAPLLT